MSRAAARPARPGAVPARSGPAGSDAPDRIVLVGFMGAGKTTVGRSLAEALGWDFRDLDACIEEECGTSVAELFRLRGESAFRELERQAARRLQRDGRLVVATGGGAWAEEPTRAVLRVGAVSVWLQCDFDTLCRRIGDGTGRPLALNHETMRGILRRREALYRLADLVVDASTDAPDVVARRILEQVGSRRDASR